MYAATKVLHASHLIAAKVITGKAIVTASIFAGTVATGYIVQSGVPPDYIDGAVVLIGNAALAESPGAAADGDSAQAGQEVQPLPRLVVLAHRMSSMQKAEYDARKRPPTRLAEK